VVSTTGVGADGNKVNCREEGILTFFKAFGCWACPKTRGGRWRGNPCPAKRLYYVIKFSPPLLPLPSHQFSPAQSVDITWQATRILIVLSVAGNSNNILTTVTMASGISQISAEPYNFPHDASFTPQTTAIIIIDMQRDCENFLGRSSRIFGLSSYKSSSPAAISMYPKA
jgi:hypothetical protein